MGQVWVVGSVNEDLAVHTDRAPSPGETVLGRALVRGPGGKGSNQAVAAARAGATTWLVAAIGADEAGARQRAALQAAGVGTEHLLAVSEPTGTALITVDSSGENSIVVVPGANAALDAPSVEHALAQVGPEDVVLAQGEVSLECVAAAARVAAEVGATMMLNLAPVVPVDLEAVGVDILVVNEHEAGLLEPEAESLDERLSRLTKRCGVVVVTQGAAGALVGTVSGLVHRVAAFAPEQVIDTTGAGDAFCGAFAAALATGADLIESVGWGMAAGAITVGAHGAQGADICEDAIRAILGTSPGAD